jgi:hypothetical protein
VVGGRGGPPVAELSGPDSSKEHIVGGPLDASELTRRAIEQTGLDDFGDIPYVEPLDVIVESLDREAGLDEAGVQAAAGTLVGLLVKRLRLVDDRKRFPAIAD